MTAHAEFEVASALTELPPLRAFVREFCRTIPFPALDEQSLNQLQLAVTEAASNIINHAYGGSTDQRIVIEADASEEQITIRLNHFGAAFDPEAARPPAFDGSREGGFGVYIIAQTVDEVHYSCDEQGRNCITLVKHLKGAQSNGNGG